MRDSLRLAARYPYMYPATSVQETRAFSVNVLKSFIVLMIYVDFIANALSAIAVYCFFEKKPAIEVVFINDG